jgi:hypothetical protein
VAVLNVPEEHAGSIVRIKNLAPEEVDALVCALQRATTGTNAELFSLLRPALPLLKTKELRDMIEALRSLYGARTGMDLPTEQFASELISAIRQREDDLRVADSVEVDRLEATFRRILSVHPLSMMAKARDLLYEYENTFCDARIITDMRPVFDTDIQSPPTEVVISHTLKVEYHHAGEHTELRIALDKDDIDVLLGVLLRAQGKSATLNALLTRSGLTKAAE